MGKKAVDPVIRLMNNIELSPDGCWNWMGSTTTNEYGDVLGIMSVGGGPTRQVHRISFEFFIGDNS
jgi:hypothetical protein